MKMKWENHGIKTPLARARGLGAASGAVEGWPVSQTRWRIPLAK